MKTFADTILEQLGGRRFIAMTGCKNFLFAERSDTNPTNWLRMDLAKNRSEANRLKIYLMPDDTYTMKFYKQTINHKTFDVVKSKEQVFENVYCEQLETIFETVTGLYTGIGNIINSK